VIHTAAWTDVDGCAKTGARDRPRTRREIAGPARAAGSISCSSPRTRSSTAAAPTARLHARRQRNPSTRTARRRPRRSGSRSRRSRLRHPARRRAGRPPGITGLVAVRAARQRLPAKNRRRRSARATRAGRSGRRDEIGCQLDARPRRGDRRTARADALVAPGHVTGIHHLVNTGPTSRSGWAREVLRTAGSRSSWSTSRLDLGPRLGAAAVGGARADHAATGEPMRRGRRRSPTRPPRCCDRSAAAESRGRSATRTLLS